MIRVGLTGTLGAGKSTVGRLFESWGARRIDTDELAREAVGPDRPAFERIRDTWGERVLGPDGQVDRAALRRLVAEDPEARRTLEQIVHPAVLELLHARVGEARAQGCEAAVLEVPLLFETDLGHLCDVVVAVDAPLEERKRRVRGERGLSSAEFLAMDRAQLSGAEKRSRADFALENDGTLADLESAARRVWDRIEARARAGGPAAESDLARQSESRAEIGPIREPASRELWTADLHMHTWHSKDCRSDPADVVSRARKVGLDRIAITDHDEIQGGFEARELAGDLVIVAEEVRTVEGLDLIGLFLSEHIAPRGSFREVADEIHRQGGITYLPHPFDRWRGSDEEFLSSVLDCVDVVEAFNARVHDPKRNERALQWAEEHGLPIGAGSDAHTLGEIGAGRVRLEPFEGPEGFLRAAAHGKIEGSTSGLWVHFGSTWAKIRKRLPL